MTSHATDFILLHSRGRVIRHKGTGPRRATEKANPSSLLSEQRALHSVRSLCAAGFPEFNGQWNGCLLVFAGFAMQKDNTPS